MENAELIGLSNQMVLRRRMDTIANNLANMNTSGFKSAELVFEKYVADEASHEAFRFGDRRLHYVVDPGTYYDLSNGTQIDTGNPLDVALTENAWFVVETPEGDRYTRDGSFKVSADGFLVDAQGRQIKGTAGPIQIGAADIDIAINANGVISSQNGELGKLQVVTFDDQRALKAAGSGLYEGIEPRPAENASVRQGALEGSNVEPISEVSEMIEVSRRYSSIAEQMKKIDDLRRTAIARLGRLDS